VTDEEPIGEPMAGNSSCSELPVYLSDSSNLKELFRFILPLSGGISDIDAASYDYFKWTWHTERKKKRYTVQADFGASMSHSELFLGHNANECAGRTPQS
jgi:hypothetical protein